MCEILIIFNKCLDVGSLDRGTDLIECMYIYTEMEALATYFDMESAHSVAGIYADFVLL
jgi:hypothetical protein